MNFIIAGITTTIATGVATSVVLSAISSVTAASNGLFTLMKNVSSSTSTGANEVRYLIKKNDLEMRIKMIQFILSELKITNESPMTLYYCISTLYDGIKDISDELSKVNYRMQYNDNLWFGSSFRAYGFKNCHARLETKILTLEKRYNMLIELLTIEKKMYRNKDLENILSESTIHYNTSPENIKKNRDYVNNTLEYFK